MVYLFGIRSHGLPILDESLMERVECDTYVRRIMFESAESAHETLASAGLRHLREDQWLSTPSACPPQSYIAEFEALLTNAGPSGSIEQAKILDPSLTPTFYAGRWHQPTKHESGRFIARREVEFGAAGWCYAELLNGDFQKLLDLPINSPMDRACDQASRRLQAAIDRSMGNARWSGREHGLQHGESVVDIHVSHSELGPAAPRYGGPSNPQGTGRAALVQYRLRTH